MQQNRELSQPLDTRIWEQYLEDSIDRLHFCKVRIVELEGEKFWFTSPSEPLLFELARQAEIGAFEPKPDELYAGHFAYSFGDKTENFKPYRERDEKSYVLHYLSRPSMKSWKASGLVMHKDSHVFSNGEDIFFGEDKHEYKGSSDKYLYCFRPMLVPLTRDGSWDKTFSSSVPDLQTTTGGYLRIQYTDAGDPFTQICGDHVYEENGRMIPEIGFPSNAMFRNIDLISETDHESKVKSQGKLKPLTWRSFGNVLICTRRFSTFMTVNEIYPLGLVPRAG